MRVVKQQHERVWPTTPSPPAAAGGGALELNGCDLSVLPHYTALLLLFPDKPPTDAFRLLKASLAETLALFYPTAGRLRATADGRLEVLCNDEGAVLYEAWVDGSYADFLPNFDPHSDLGLLNTAPRLPDLKLMNVSRPPPSLHSLSYDDRLPPAISELPLFVAQVTHFQCGRTCLGISMHHTLVDAHSMSQFLSCWAKLTKLKSNPDLHKLELDLGRPLQQPYLDRSLLKPNRLPPASPAMEDHTEYDTCGIMEMPPFGMLCGSKIFSFTPSDIDAIRERLPRPAARQYTRFETLAAHLARGMTWARGLAPQQETRWLVTVNGRKRFKDPLPETYFGNVIFYGHIAATAGEVLEKPVSFAAALVKDAIAKVSDEYMRSALDWIAGKPGQLMKLASPRAGVDMVVSSWLGFSFDGLDFGWGKPAFVRLPGDTFMDGVVIMLPSPHGVGHVDAVVGLQEAHMPKLEEYLKDHASLLGN